MKKIKIIDIIFIVAWMIVIFLFSAADSNKSNEQSDEVIVKIVETIKQEKLTPKERKNVINKYVVIVRKGAHFFLYFVLALLVYILIHIKYGTSMKTFLITLLICVIYAITDELHQIFSDGRTAQVIDVLIDSSGSILAESILTVIYLKKDKKKKLKSEPKEIIEI